MNTMTHLLITILATAVFHYSDARNSQQNVQVMADGSSEHDRVGSVVCRDQHELCSFWADSGECLSNPDYMAVGCPESCATCDVYLMTHQSNPEAADVAVESSSVINPEYIQHLLDRSLDFGVRQTATGSDTRGTLTRIEESISYMKDGKTLSLPFDVLDNCFNRHELCSFWAHSGECESNKSFMNLNCAPSCFSCNVLDMKARCPPLHDAEPALRPGDLNKMFTRISDNEMRELDEPNMPAYTARILSSPGDDLSDEITADADKSLPPWILLLENFLSPEECDALVELGNQHEFFRSLDLGPQRFDGSFEKVISDRITSDEFSCAGRLGCRDEEAAAGIHERMATVLDIPSDNIENLLILRYEEGQYHRTHHDYLAHQTDRQCGPRILTFHMFLNDADVGGGIEFPYLDIYVKPKKGDVLLWPNVLNSNPMTKDGRVIHQVLELEAGTHFAVDAWVHLYDYLGPHTNGCF